MTTEVKVIIGSNAGDEGKGLATDYFATMAYSSHKTCLVVLSNGGSQRGHTVEALGRKHVFKHFGSGTYVGAYTYIPRYYIVNPMNYAHEFYQLLGEGIEYHPTYINDQCLLSTPFDMIANMLIEDARGNQRHGSCGVGIWETILRDGITVGEMAIKTFEEQVQYLEFVRDTYFVNRLSSKNITKYGDYESIIFDQNLILNYLNDFNFMINNSIFTDDKILQIYDCVIFENGQGLLLDQNIEGYGKNTTPSNTGLQNPAEMISQLPEDISVEVCYVSRTYMTRHGVGRFDTECPDLRDKLQPDQTNSWNHYQGNLRYGVLEWPDLEKRVVDDFKKYGKDDWKLSFFFTHTNENDDLPWNQIANYGLYTSSGKNMMSVKQWTIM